MSASLQRAMLLLQQSRYDLAEKELRAALASDPNDPAAHAFLALCLVEREELAEATREAGESIMLAPDLSLGHFALAVAFFRRDRPEEAERAVSEAIRLDPSDADAHALRAGIMMARRRWADALAAAEQGLIFDPEHVGCNNYRAMALVQLGRRAEAGATIAAALARNPEEAFSHANQGWTLLHEGKPKPAMEHFREALRIDPTIEFARAGIVEAMKARNPIYRVMLGYFLWMSRLSRRAQWVVLLAFIFVRPLLASIGRASPTLAPITTALLIATFVFLVMTWISVPLFNLLLRLNRFGRLALSDEQVTGSNWLGAYLLSGLACLVAAIARDDARALEAAINFGLLLLPVGGTFLCPKGWPRDAMKAISLVLTAFGPGAIAVMAFASSGSAIYAKADQWHDLFYTGVMLSTWGAVLLSMHARVRR